MYAKVLKCAHISDPPTTRRDSPRQDEAMRRSRHRRRRALARPNGDARLSRTPRDPTSAIKLPSRRDRRSADVLGRPCTRPAVTSRRAGEGARQTEREKEGQADVYACGNAWKSLVSIPSRTSRNRKARERIYMCVCMSGVGGGRYGPRAATAASEASPFFLQAFLPPPCFTLSPTPPSPPSFPLTLCISLSLSLRLSSFL